MKHIKHFVFVLMAEFATAFTACSQPTRIDVRAEVYDPDGQPVESATVVLGAPRYRMGEKDVKTEAQTDKKGIAELSVQAETDYALAVSKPGYYRTVGPHRSIATPTQATKYATGTQVVRLELRPIRNPLRGVTRVVYRSPLPGFGKSAGFDLLVGDWVAPFGKGSVADFIFTLTGYVRSQQDFDENLSLAFSQIGDGIMVFKAPPNSGSVFKFPYDAPLDDYLLTRAWRNAYDGKTRRLDNDLSRETNYIFRVRSERDGKGNVIRALYGVIVDEIEVLGTNETGFNITFCYRLNPDYTRNLEFDPPEVATR